MERTIRVTGKGKISVRPDTLRLSMDLTGLREKYEEAIRISAEAKERMDRLVEACGFQAEDLKSISFSVDPEQEGYRDENGDWKSRFKGYRYRHSLRLEFPEDHARLGQLLGALAENEDHPEFSFDFTVADPESVKNMLLAAAVKDAGMKAGVLASSLGVKLGQVITVDYSFAQINLVSESRGRMMAMPSVVAKNMDMTVDMTPEDIEVTDTVTVIWGIE